LQLVALQRSLIVCRFFAGVSASNDAFKDAVLRYLDAFRAYLLRFLNGLLYVKFSQVLLSDSPCRFLAVSRTNSSLRSVQVHQVFVNECLLLRGQSHSVLHAIVLAT
jgi:hypothetical protein